LIDGSRNVKMNMETNTIFRLKENGKI